MSSFPAGPFAIRPISSRPAAGLEPFQWSIPGSKSITNRALILAALAEGESLLRGVLHSDDTGHMRRGLEQMGVEISDLDATTWSIRGGKSRLRPPSEPIFVGNSGTTVRFLAALACLVPGAVNLVGDEHMAVRPIADLVDGLRQLGVEIDCETGCPPLTIHGGKLPDGSVSMPGGKSSQYFSALLMAAPAASGPIDIVAEGALVSRPYVEITRNMVAAFGGQISCENDHFTVEPRELTGCEFTIEPDASSASYAFAAAAVTGLPVEVLGLTTGALQGDYAFVDLLEAAGARVEKGSAGTLVQGPAGGAKLQGLDVDMHHISDTVMTLAAIAPVLEAETCISNVANIRIKETDRLTATVAELERLGQHVEFGEDWFKVAPRPVADAVVRSYSDHRMAMSFAILGLVAEGVSIEDPACVAKTYPSFWGDLDQFRSWAEG